MQFSYCCSTLKSRCSKSVLLYKCSYEELLSKHSFSGAYCLRACELISSPMFRLIQCQLVPSSLRAQHHFQTSRVGLRWVELVGKWMLACYPSLNFYICISAFSRRFYPKRLTVHSGYTFFFHYVCSLGIELTTFCAALPLSHRN